METKTSRIQLDSFNKHYSRILLFHLEKKQQKKGGSKTNNITKKTTEKGKLETSNFPNTKITSIKWSSILDIFVEIEKKKRLFDSIFIFNAWDMLKRSRLKKKDYKRKRKRAITLAITITLAWLVLTMKKYQA